jgi:uncharacterized protein (TIGR02246 family)
MMLRFLNQYFLMLLLAGLVLAPNSAKTQNSIAQPAPGDVLKEPDSRDLAAFAAVLEEQDRAWAKGDADAYTARVLPTVSFTNVVGAYSVGKEPLLKQVNMIFSTIYKGSHLKSQLVHASLIGDDVALVDLTTELRDYVRPPSGADVVDGAVHTRMQEVLVRRQGQWWVASLHNVLIKSAFLPGTSAPK